MRFYHMIINITNFERLIRHSDQPNPDNFLFTLCRQILNQVSATLTQLGCRNVTFAAISDNYQ